MEEIEFGKHYQVVVDDPDQEETAEFVFIPEYRFPEDHEQFPAAYWGRDLYGISGIVYASEFVEEVSE